MRDSILDPALRRRRGIARDAVLRPLDVATGSVAPLKA
jgi:hypothetical protein